MQEHDELEALRRLFEDTLKFIESVKQFHVQSQTAQAKQMALSLWGKGNQLLAEIEADGRALRTREIQEQEKDG